MSIARFRGGGDQAAAAAAEVAAAAAAGAAAAVAALLPRRPNLADRVFSFCMKAAIVLSTCYLAFLVCLVLFVSELQFGKLQLLPFFSAAILVPLYALALLQEYGA